ncbi:MAG: hypothetical protein M9921_13965 [Fimbriimonadaceae bacterium]|nr:hypothetical protein [Fimbriimonadaceae bacterium]
MTSLLLLFAGQIPYLSAPGTLVVLNKGAATASIVSLKDGTTLRTVPTGEGPHEVAISEDGKNAVACNYGAATPGNSLTVFTVPEGKVLRTIDLGAYTRPHGIAWLDSQRVAVTSETTGNLVVVDVASGKVEKAIPTGQQLSHMVALDAKGKRAYTANIGSGSISALDLATGTRLAIVPTGKGAEGIDVSPDGSQVWVTNREDGTVSVVDAKTLKVIATMPCGAFSIRVKFTPNGKQALVSNARGDEMVLFDVATRKIVGRLDVNALGGRPTGPGGYGPVGVLVHPNGKVAYVALSGSEQVAVVDLRKRAVVGTIQAGDTPDGMAFSGR